MVEKGAKKKISKKKTTHKKHSTEKETAKKSSPVTINLPEQKESKVDKMLMENFISLQKVMTNLSVKLDGLATQISKLLELFEISAKALADKDFDVEQNNKELVEKMETLVDQNKTIARGLTLMHERIPREMVPPPMPQRTMPPQPPPMMPTSQPMNFSSSPQMPVPQTTGMKKPLSKEITPEQEVENKPTFESPI